MYCENCGKPINDGEKCKCQKNDGNKKKSIVLIAGIALAIILCLVFFVTRPEKIQLGDYLAESLEVVGLDGHAHFEVEDAFESKAFMNAVIAGTKTSNGKLDENSTEEEFAQALLGMGEQISAYEEVEDSIVLEVFINGDVVEEPTNLKNGDKVTIKVSSKLDVSDTYNKKFIGGSKEYEINSLEEAIVYSPFDESYFSIVYSGIDGKAIVDWKLSEESPLSGYVKYELVGEQYDKFSNGDTFILQAEGNEKRLLEEGIVLAETTKEFTVAGLGRYVSSLDDITEEMLEELESSSETKITASPKSKKLTNIQYQNGYFMSLKGEDNKGSFVMSQPQNRLIFVYTATDTSANKEAYICVVYKDVTTDGTKCMFDGHDSEELAAEVNSYLAFNWESTFEKYGEIYNIEIIK